MKTDNTMPPWAVRPITPEAVYTDRTEHLEYLYEYALETVPRRSMSTVLSGAATYGQDRGKINIRKAYLIRFDFFRCIFCVS